MAGWVLKAKSQSPDSSRTARSLDGVLQDYAYRAIRPPKTGVVYEAEPPPDLPGIKLAAMRLRSGSLKRKGVKSFFEFEIPVGVVEQPYVERLVLVYQNLGNWSSSYYNLQGYSFITPVLGLLAYDAINLSAKNLSELNINATGQPIFIRFSNVQAVQGGFTPRCVWFDLDGLPQFTNLVSSDNVCSTFSQGHFCIAVNSSAFPPPSGQPPLPPSFTPSKKSNSRTWKIVGGVVGGFVGLVLLILLLVWALRKRQSEKIAKMEQQSETGEALRMATVGTSRAPVAMGTRTPPVLENEYVP
ncbi:hypothetical protein H6P81_014699 [Aristolochia fimbriata]|uniref:Uncharacterized protein n=1 Tax=Aristolochia fimbriata TaxID=158543 RepID=A0AAV7E3G3_ARIFI|nr:hypothetical protein H6P81_014699 [Aristolochia fimbriata]